MDLVTSAIIAAIEQGTRVAVVRDIVALSYTHLKNIILQKVADPDDVLQAIASVELEPDSVPLQFALRDTLKGANVSGDVDVLMAAQTLLYHIKPPPMVAVTPTAPSAALATATVPTLQAQFVAPAQPVPARAAGAQAQAQYAVVKVFFATDRNPTTSELPVQHFGAQRSELSYGSCEVSVPRDQRMGELELPTLWRLELREDPERQVVLLDAKVQHKDVFLAGLSARIQRSAKKSALLFVHGYNVTFEEAARRTGQLCYDLAFDGAPLFYSWPSQGTPFGYMLDEASIEWSQANLTLFLLDFLDKTDAQNIYVIGHGMGNRALAGAAAAVLAQQPALAQRIAEIILTAPDIDATVFRRELAPALAGARNPVTLYAASGDMALAASKQAHGYRRAGDSGAGLIVMDRVETIDASGVDTSMLKHAHFADTPSTLSDIFDLIQHGARPDQRFLEPVAAPDGRYWAFKK